MHHVPHPSLASPIFTQVLRGASAFEGGGDIRHRAKSGVEKAALEYALQPITITPSTGIFSGVKQMRQR